MLTKQEKELIKNISNGDSIAFQELHRHYFQSLYLFAQKFLESESAKDVVQECFISVWQNRKKVEVNSSLTGYLFTTVKNRCYKWLIREQKAKNSNNHLALKLKLEELDFYSNSEKSILEFDLQDQIKKALDLLPEKCRSIFIESRFEGLSYKEIAARNNISVKAIEKHISKALKILRKELLD